MTVYVFDERACLLGEGPLWHPEREQLLWFDILNKKLMTQNAGKACEWAFDETVSAAGWVDQDVILVASATGLWSMELSTGSRDLIVPLEADNAITRSNDGRADPWGGFWIGTMGYKAERGAGAIYRYFQGNVRKLYSDITIANSICFTPNRSHAYFTDTPTRKVMKVSLDHEGWPTGSPEKFLDLTKEEQNPDGAVVDAKGWLWLAKWGASRVSAYDTSGRLQTHVSLPARQITCPAFGGRDYTTLYVTSAAEGLDTDKPQGQTFAIEGIAQGVPEPRVVL